MLETWLVRQWEWINRRPVGKGSRVLRVGGGGVWWGSGTGVDTADRFPDWASGR